MYQATQRSLDDVLTLAALQTVIQVERLSRQRDNRRIDKVAGELQAIAGRTGGALDPRRANGCTILR